MSTVDFVRNTLRHRLDFTRVSDRLVVSFDNAGAPGREPADRRPWGHKFLTENGYSVLGVIPSRPDWYRCAALHEALVEMRDEGFFRRFSSVAFTGSSMGGYAAAAFSSLSPGSTVVSFNPQSTLRHDLAPWDTLHVGGAAQDWTGLFADSAAEVASAGKVYIFYDPFHELDRLHADRYTSPNVVRMRSHFLAHGLPGSFLAMGVLKEVMRESLAGRLTPEGFAKLLRTRKELPAYYKGLLAGLRHQRHSNFGLGLAERGIEKFDDAFFQIRRALHLAAKGQVEEAAAIADRVESARPSPKLKAMREAVSLAAAGDLAAALTVAETLEAERRVESKKRRKRKVAAAATEAAARASKPKRRVESAAPRPPKGQKKKRGVVVAAAAALSPVKARRKQRDAVAEQSPAPVAAPKPPALKGGAAERQAAKRRRRRREAAARAAT